MNRYITYEAPFQNRTFTENQIKQVYQDLVNKNEYPDFNIWIFDMLKIGIFKII